MKTNRQGLDAPDSLALPNHIPASAARTNEESVQRLDGHEYAPMLDLCPGGTVTLGDSKYLVQQRVFHASLSYPTFLEKTQTFRKNPKTPV
jgi:hypothetical protein